jgi:hypothetical protein
MIYIGELLPLREVIASFNPFQPTSRRLFYGLSVSKAMAFL